MSKTYLEWAKENMQLNGQVGRQQLKDAISVRWPMRYSMK
ncbi:23S rRNA m(2)G2445 methyltransferase [Vibrio cholerae]|nr:23S rRNA m(2)G2445 methyltransferase [Vibrio cholerae]